MNFRGMTKSVEYEEAKELCDYLYEKFYNSTIFVYPNKKGFQVAFKTYYPSKYGPKVMSQFKKKVYIRGGDWR